MEVTVNEVFVSELNQHLPIARRIARIYFPDTDDRQDVLQEMMFQLWRSFPGFDGRSKFSTWMYRVCLNTALTYVRKGKTRGELLTQAHDQIAEEVPTERNERMEQLIAAIGLLSPVNKAIIMLYLEEMSYEEIASITGLTKSNVSVKIMRIKKELETGLKNS